MRQQLLWLLRSSLTCKEWECLKPARAQWLDVASPALVVVLNDEAECDSMTHVK